MNNIKNDPQKDRPSYKDTLNLLQTSFGMRANATQREPELQAFWREKKIDFELGLNNSGETFTLHDGPPYANGTLHMGHALNKVLKDIINKFQLMKGKKVCFVPGWDCHGLPIELKVLQQLDKEQRSALTPFKLRKKAAAYARKQIDNQMKGFKRWGIWADWDKPYLTLDKNYEAAQIELFGEMVLSGYIYRGLKPVHWSPSSQTALAEAELEYPEDHTSISAYIAFPAIHLPEELRLNLVQQGFNFPSSEQELSKVLKIAIWTTTPWTLPANLAISINERLDYVFAKINENQFIILAQDLLKSVSEKLSIDLRSIATVKGALLEGIIYNNPLFSRNSPVIIGGDYVTTETGTGLVHTAPGHGVDDFNTGRKNGLEVLCPVNEKGFFTSEAGQFEGLNVLKDANQQILKALDEQGLLLKEELYSHRYPYDWRTKKPTIFRATEQWFASLEGFRDKALDSIGNVIWLPKSGRNRIEAMVKERGDWCISRQRNWGVPIPVFYHRDNGEVLVNAKTLEHIYKLVEALGSDVWWEKEEAELLPEPYRSESHKWRKGTDTMDVWFDSGSSWSGVLKARDLLNFPADLYLEGSDQHRGWFQSSLLTSVAVNDCAPYQQVLTHGFVLDENGRKMSKSLGNIIDPDIIINGGVNKKIDPSYGADVLRLWVSSVDYSVDVPIGKGILKQISDVYRKIRNTSRYLLGNLHDFSPEKDSIPIDELPILDRWMLARTADVIDEIDSAFKAYEFSKFFQTLQGFCVVDLSNFYLDIAKDRLYVSAPDDKRRRSCQTVLSILIETLASLISPVLCHMAEDIWQNIPYKLSEDSVFKKGWPSSSEIWKDDSLSIHITRLRDLRTTVNRALEECRNKNDIGAALQASIRLDCKFPELQESIDWLNVNGDPEVDSLRDWFLVSNLQLGGEPWAETLCIKEDENIIIEVAKARGQKCQRCWHYKLDIIKSRNHDCICSRCVDILNRLSE